MRPARRRSKRRRPVVNGDWANVSSPQESMAHLKEQLDHRPGLGQRIEEEHPADANENHRHQPADMRIPLESHGNGITHRTKQSPVTRADGQADAVVKSPNEE